MERILKEGRAPQYPLQVTFPQEYANTHIYTHRHTYTQAYAHTGFEVGGGSLENLKRVIYCIDFEDSYP